jgi:hypothetical protein
MPLFDAYIMVDWSGNDRRRAGKQDCIWIAHGLSKAITPTTVSPRSRTEAEHLIRAQLQPTVAAKKGRVLLCADFGYGYPAGFASLLSKSVPGELPPWRIVWQYLSKYIQDDLGTKPGRQPTNRTQSLRGRERNQSLPVESSLPRSILVSFQARRLRLRSTEKAPTAIRMRQ